MSGPNPRRIVYICDWLPPDYGAVGQYSDLFARALAGQGHEVVLGGLTSGASATVEETVGTGSLETVKLATATYAKDRLIQRLWWTIVTNTRLMLALWTRMWRADDILFTGSPPLLLHWIAPANLVLRKRLIYRITDFHPECLMAAQAKPSPLLQAVYRLTLFWRRRVDLFEILGEDQRARLVEIGIPSERIALKRDPSPVDIPEGTQPLSRPAEGNGKLLLLYSGNWGVAHDVDTFVAAYERHHRAGSARFVLWLNAVGAKADTVAAALTSRNLPLVRSKPVPLDQLARLLVTPDAHLITLLDPFVGFVLPSKVYGCIESELPVLYIGSERSDVHLLCRNGIPHGYHRVPVGDIEAGARALELLADDITSQRGSADRRTSDTEHISSKR